MSDRFIEKGGTGLSNFMAEQRPLYEAAIKEYGDPYLVIKDEPLPDANGRPIVSPNMHSLHDLKGKRPEGLSGFWKIFDRHRRAASVDV